MRTFRLHLLGGFTLEKPRGGVVRSLAHGRPEAILAVLAVCGDLGSTRDRLIGLLWAERNESAARHALRDVLYAIRRSLGREAVPSTGDTLHLAPGVVSSDVREFEEALQEGRLADAVAAYRGPLLDGFHLGNAAEFDRWLEGERARLLRERQRAVGELALAAEADGRWSTASEWWARAAAADPYDSRTAARRMVALARAGDRANAVLQAEAHCRLLQSDLDLEPDGAFLAELERIRRGVVGPSGPPSSGRPAGSGSNDRSSPPDQSAAAARDVPSTPEVVEESARPVERTNRYRALGIAVVVLASVALAAAVLLPFPSGTLSGPAFADPVQVSAATGIEASLSWSPDGLALAYESTRDGDSDIWVTRLGTGAAANRTPDNPTADRYPRWSPDGRWIAFFSARQERGYFLMPAMGGTPRKVAPLPHGEPYPTPAEWSPDGRELAYALNQRREPWLRFVDPTGRESRRLALPVQSTNNTVADLTWSPDGRFLAYRRAFSPMAANGELWLTDLSSGESSRLTDGSHRDWSPSWSPDSRQLFFLSDRGGLRDLWRFTLDDAGMPTGTPRQITSGLELTEVAVSPDGRRIGYTKGRDVGNVFRAPILTDRAATWADLAQLTFDDMSIEAVNAAPDGRLLLSSNRSGNWDIYMQSAGGGPLRRLTTDPALDDGPSWGPDGKRVAFYSARGGHRQVWLLPLDGGPPRQLTDGPSEKLYPTWSPGGGEIVVKGDGIAVFSVEDGAKRQLTRSPLDVRPDWSPDGRWIAFSSLRDGRSTLWRVPAAGGEAERLSNVPGRVPRWSRDGEEIYFFGAAERSDTIWALSLATREVRPLTALEGRPGRIGGIGLASDGRHVYLTWRESRADVWVTDLVPPLEP